ncbi:hypothetical protein CPB83DRAFT_811822 [Crepidotus variabilis]|uniref:Alpha/beta hydrolase fold-3 domain-containing protein n=1 Tax=Crepidotus variabilis TaxID=179855 RepID=A0A9P6JRN5_9AGAR|nr:hypothetical protein CPB83DRAFT_811822 [Crepidotus variabilis]
MNSLTRDVGFKVGPVILEVLVKHYFERRKKDAEDEDDSGQKLKGDDVLYHEAFTIAKAHILSFLSSHTVEELQSFSNTRTPSPPWTHVVRTLVPLSCCDEAATYLIKALGGEDIARDLVGGVKWWQVRGVNGIDAQWITAKKDWEEAERKRKQEHKQKLKDGLASPPPTENHRPDGVYEKDMDAMRCILYLHGGGYYFGSVDQERYSIQRFARKINGRVFAINYRLAPQYPFPCALQDAVAAYLYLIQPPSGSEHCAVNPAHIIIAGDSAGGGLSIALLQVIRDSGLPLPAGAFLISPWCDLTHSFPSIHLNTHSDIVPESGLSFHKPSTLWPPPPIDVSTRVRASLRFRIRQAFKLDNHPTQTDTILSEKDLHLGRSSADVDPKTPLVPPSIPVDDREKVAVQSESGHSIEVHDQLQFYTQNSLLPHPLVSPVTGYLGGLPPLFITAGDEEVLRDEIIYLAHKAAYPERYPIDEQARSLYPVLKGIEDRYKPTSVHLQVYDGTPHILPVLFSFCTPAKYCFRGIASFCKFVTEMATNPAQAQLTRSAHRSPTSSKPDTPPRRPSTAPKSSSARSKEDETQPFAERLMEKLAVGKENETSISSSDVGGPRFQVVDAPPEDPVEMTAGEIKVYQGIKDRSTWECRMIRERVSTSGVVRPLEAEDQLEVFKVMDPHRVGRMPEKTMQRYLRDRGIFDKKFEHTTKTIAKVRRRTLEKAKADTIKRMHDLKKTMRQKGKLREKVLSSPGWVWAWALDEHERPPPSSIVSRRDTEEARKLAAVADWATQQEDQTMSANNLWAVIQTFLTATPGKDSHVLRKGKEKKKQEEEAAALADFQNEKKQRKSLDEPKSPHLGVPSSERRAPKKRRSFLDLFHLRSRDDSTQISEVHNGDTSSPMPLSGPSN